MLGPMPTSPPARLLCALAVFALSLPCAALELRSVQVQGLTDEEMRDNVDDALSLQRLNPARRRVLTETRLSWLLRQAPDEARRALEPFGYYDPKIDPQVRRDGDAIDVIVVVDPGQPVLVATHAIELLGPAHEDSALMRRLQRFRPRIGRPFHHGQYEDSKAAMDRALAGLGYFDAEQTAHRVTVNRAAHSADIELAWTSGERYAFGAATFAGHQFRPGLLENLVPWHPGEPYDQAKLLALHASLTELDYFAAVDIRAEPESADAERRVPVQVALTPGKRDVYSAGVRYGTDTGLGVAGGFERRWVNDRGHKLRAAAGIAQRRTDVSAQYRIPAFAWIDGWYTAGVSLRQEEIDGVDSELFEAIGSRSGRLGDWTLTAALNFRRERFEDPTQDFTQRYSTLVFPSLLAQWSEADDLLYPRNARGLTVELRGGHTAIGSDIDFLQLRAEGRWIRPFGRRNRLLLRAEAGTTMSDDFAMFPPSLRFYAGGDLSVRGYGYKEIGEHVIDPDGERFVFGGKHLLVASAEFERMFNRTWGAAAFIDAGDAFDNGFQAQAGVGVGLRWHSPVGPVRLDVAHGFGADAQQSVRLHLNIGPDL
jgi:translocation and assembly module TamA